MASSAAPSASAAAAAAAAAAASASDDASTPAAPATDTPTTTADAAETDQTAALQAQVAALQKQLRERALESASANAGTGQIDPEIQAIVEEHRRQQEALKMGMQQAVQSAEMRDKLALDLEAGTGNSADVEPVLQLLQQIAAKPKYAPLIKYVSAAAGAAAGQRASDLQKSLDQEQAALREQAAKVDLERQQKELLQQTLDQMQRATAAREAIVGSKRARTDVRPAGGFGVRNYAGMQPSIASSAAVPQTTTPVAAPAPAEAGQDASATIDPSLAAARAQAEQAKAQADAAAAAAAAEAAAPPLPQGVRLLGAPPTADPSILALARQQGPVQGGMGVMNIPAFVGKDYGARPSGVDPSTGALPPHGSISASGPAIPLPFHQLE